MAWILNQETNRAINLDYIVSIKFTDEMDVFEKCPRKKWRVFAVSVNDDYMDLASFDTKEEAQKHVFDIVRWQESGTIPDGFLQKK